MLSYQENNPNIEEEETDQEISESSSYLNKLINDSLVSKAPQRQEYVTDKPEISDLESKLRYTKFKESSNRPWQVNDKKQSAPTTGYLHIEQPTYVEQLKKKYGEDVAKTVGKLSPKDYVKYIQSNPDEEEEIGKHIIKDKVEKWGEAKIIDNNGREEPAWRVAYTMGDSGFKRFLKNSRQRIASNE